MINTIKMVIAIVTILIGLTLFISAVVFSWPELQQIQELQRQAMSRVWPYIVGGLVVFFAGFASLIWWN